MKKVRNQTEKEIIFDLISDGIVIINHDKVEFTNSYFNKLTGFSDLAGKSVLQFIDCVIPKKDIEQRVSRFKEILEGSDLHTNYVSIDLLTKNRQELYTEVKATRYISDDEYKIVIVIKDVTQSAKLLNSLETSSLFLNKMPNALIVLDINRNIIKTNDAACILWSKTNEEILGEPVLSLFPESLHEDHRKKLRIIAENNIPMTFQSSALTSTHKQIPIEIIGETMKDDDGNLIGYIGVISNISDRILSIEKLNTSYELLELSEQRLREAQKVAQIGSFQGTNDTDELWWSNELFSLFGLDPLKYTPTKDAFTGLVHPDEQDAYNEQLYKSLETGDYFHREFRGRHSDGEWKDFETNANALYNEKNEIIGLHGTVQNITERKQNEKRLRVSAERFERWKSSNFIGVLHSTAGGKIIDANESFLNMIGYSKEDVQNGNLDWTKLTPPEFIDLDNKAMEEASKTGTWTPFEKEYIKKNGHRVPILIGGSIFKETQDEFIVFIIDLSEQKKTEEILQLATKTAKVGYYDWQIDKNELHWDKKMHEIFELDEESTISRFEYFNSSVHPDDEENVRKTFESSMNPENSNSEFNNTYKILINSNQVKYIENNSLHIRNDEGVVQRIIGTTKDITKRKELEQRLVETLQDTENQVISRTKELELSQSKLKQSLIIEKELNELKTRFVSTASHQFRTPLSVIQANIGLIEMQTDKMDTALVPKIDIIFKRVKDQIKGMTDLMDDILIIGKVNTEKLVIHTEPTNLVELCEKIGQNYDQIQTTNRALIIQTNGSPRLIDIDPKLIGHALSNLVSNAFKYSPNFHSPNLSINFTDSNVEIVITDKGIGIPGDEINTLFDPFYRASNAHEFSGTGLGSSIAKEYIQLNGGTIHVNSTVGEGSEFIVTF